MSPTALIRRWPSAFVRSDELADDGADRGQRDGELDAAQMLGSALGNWILRRTWPASRPWHAP